MKEMRKMMKLMLAGILLLAGTTTMNAEDNNVTSEIDTTYIKLDENREPINHVNLTYEELVEKVGELETILETDEFQLYACGDYTYKVLAQSNSIKDTHNTGGNYYQYANFQVQFDDFEGYEKLTFSVIPVE